jgi:AraC-like DNA-binding protein
MHRRDFMKSKSQKGNALAAPLAAMALSEGPNATAVPGVKLYRLTQRQVRQPTIYEASIILLAQGRKRGYLGRRVFEYDANNYLVIPAPVPMECEIDASPTEPVLAISVDVVPRILGELLVEMDEPFTPPAQEISSAVYASPITPRSMAAALRLLECAVSPTDARILGPALVRELYYLVLQEKQGTALRAMGLRHTHFGQIARVMHRLHRDYAERHDVESMAGEANMSSSAFHQHFKAMTSQSPLQYLKRLRLGNARLLLLQDGYTAAAAARAVGYESVSQFSREFKRLFGRSPAADAGRARGAVVKGPDPARPGPTPLFMT